MRLTRVSVDCWGTLIKSSPFFAEAKLQLVKKYFPSLTDEEISSSFSEVKNDYNTIIESTGWQPTKDMVYTHLLNKLCGYQKIKIDDFYRFQFEYNDLAKEHLPVIYSDETLENIEKLSQIATLTISSNTMMISGRTLRLALDQAGLSPFFKEFFFSDEKGYAKPNSKMYNKSHFHIGDNERTDYYGALNALSKPILINSTENTIADAYDYIAQGG